jgi:dihydroorotase
MALLIKNATVVNPDKIGRQRTDILIERGKIARIGHGIPVAGGKVIDAQGKYVAPGLVDMHVHLREPGREDKETIETGMRAAAKGGFTTVMCMPNTDPVIDNGMMVDAVLKEAARVGTINVIPAGAVTRGQRNEELTDMFELKEAGCLALSDDGNTVLSSKLMRLALEYARMTGLLIVDHCQDVDLTGNGVMNEGRNATILGLKGDPAIAETVMIARDLEIAHYLKARIHIAHISLKRSVELIRMAKKQGVLVTAEVCPHHFTLTDEMLCTFDTNLKVNPPLRTRGDVSALKKGLRDGTIDCIVTDHAPHTMEDKEVDFDHAPCGMIGLETALGLAVTELIDGKVLSWSELIQKMAFAPAQVLGLSRKGKVEVGYDADLVVIDPQKEWVVDETQFLSKSRNSPFIGRTLKGLVETTICKGKVVYAV